MDAEAPSAARDFLPGARLWLVQRVRTGSGRPFALMQSWLPDAIASAITPKALEDKQSLYRILQDEFDTRTASATEVIRAEAADRNEARKLDIPTGSPLLVTYRWTSDHRGQPVEYVRSASPGEIYQVVAKLHQ